MTITNDGVAEELTPEIAENLEKQLDPLYGGEMTDLPSPVDAKDEQPDEPAEEEAEEEAPALDDNTLQMAEELGLDVEDLGAEKVQAIVNHAERAAFRQFQSLMQTEGDDEQEQAPPVARNDRGQFQAKQQHQPEPPVPDTEVDLPPLEFKLDPEDYGEELVDVVKGFNSHLAHYKTQVDNLSQMVQSQIEEAENLRFDETATWFDQQVNELGDESVFGKGRINALRPDSEHVKNRHKLFKTYQEVLAYRHESGLTKNEEAMRQAMQWAQLTDGSKEQSEKLSKKVSERSKKTIGKPSGRKRSTPNFEDDVDPASGHPKAIINDLQRRLNEMLG